MNNKIVAWTIFAQDQNKDYAAIMTKMWKHFNPEIEMKEFSTKEIEASQDGNIFYRATPYFTRKLMDEGYTTVIKVDADSFIFGDISEALIEDYDVGVVNNWNRTDYKTYGLIQVADITPQEYVNCGFVIMKNRKFVDHWFNLCYSKHFDRLQYKEQDILNIICNYGEYLVKSLDDSPCWHGLISKGENAKFELRNGHIVLPKANDKYPEKDKLIKVYHVAGGKQENKMNYKILFSPEIQAFIESTGVKYVPYTATNK